MSRMTRSTPHLRKPVYSRPGESSKREEGREVRIEELKREVRELEQEHTSVLKALKEKYQSSPAKETPAMGSPSVKSSLLEEREALKEYRKYSTDHIQNIEVQLKKNKDFYEREIRNLQGYVNSLRQKIDNSKLTNSDRTNNEQYYEMYVQEKERARTFYKALKKKEVECEDVHKSLEISIGERDIELRNKDRDTETLHREINVLHEQLNSFKGKNFRGQIEKVADKIFENIQFLDSKVKHCEENLQKLNKMLAKFRPKPSSDENSALKNIIKQLQDDNKTKKANVEELQRQIAEKDMKFARLVAEHEKIMKREKTETKDKFNEVYSILKEKEDEIKKLNDKHAKEKRELETNLEEAQEKFNTEINRNQKKIEELQHIISKTDKDHTPDFARINELEEYKHKVIELEKDRDSIQTNLNKQINDLVTERTNMLETNNSHLASISNLNTQLFDAKETIQQMGKKFNDNEIVLQQTNQECSNLKLQKDILYEEINTLSVQLENSQTEKQAFIERLNKEKEMLTDKLTKEKAMQIERKDSEREQVIENLKEEHDQKISNLHKENDLKIEKVIKENDEKFLNLTREKDSTIENLVKEHDSQITNLVKEKDQLIDRLIKEKTIEEEKSAQTHTKITSDKIKALEKEIEEKASTIDNLTLEIDERVDIITKEKDTIIENLTREIMKLSEENRNIKSSSSARKYSDDHAADLENKNLILQQTLESLNAQLNQATERTKEYEKKINGLNEGTVRELKKQNTTLKEDFSSLQETLSKANEESEVYKREMEKYKESYNQQHSVIVDLDKEIKTLEQSKDFYEKSTIPLEKHNETVQKLTKDLTRALEEVGKLREQQISNEKAAKDSQMLQKIQLECAELNSKMIKASENCEHFKDQFLKANERIEILNNVISDKDSELKKLSEEKEGICKAAEEVQQLNTELKEKNTLIQENFSNEHIVFEDESLKNAGIRNNKDLVEAYSALAKDKQQLSQQIEQLKVQEHLTEEKETIAHDMLDQLKSELQEKDSSYKDQVRSLNTQITYLEKLNKEMAIDHKNKEQTKIEELTQTKKELEQLKSLNYDKMYTELKQVEEELMQKLETSNDRIYELETELGQTKAKLYQEKDKNEEMQDQIHELMANRR